VIANQLNKGDIMDMIGKQYLTRGKAPRLCTVTDKHTTTNSDGEVVKVRYVSVHDFMGQHVVNLDVVRATILRGEVTE
jgi:hypothetical protein